MGQAQYWMWMKRREILNPFSESWEEKAFAEDAAGSLGGCVWPPRSYSCSFCKREFKSAQALGGHMNVHRRDRARLKQSLSLHNEVLHQQNHNHTSGQQLEPKCSSEVGTSDYNLDHNKCPCNIVASSTLSPSRVSALSTQENLSENTTLVSRDSSSFLEEKHKGSKSLSHDDYVETNLSVGLNSVFCRVRPTGSCNDEAISCKRTKTDSVATLPFFLKNNHKYGLHMEVLGFRSSPNENLDLELRLGHPPKVK